MKSLREELEQSGRRMQVGKQEETGAVERRLERKGLERQRRKLLVEMMLPSREQREISGAKEEAVRMTEEI